MSNRLKKFIWDNRTDFDDAAPSGNVWDNIEAAMTEKKKEKRSIVMPLLKWSMAAAAVFMIGTGIYFLMNKNTTEKPPVASTHEPDLNNLAPEDAREVNQFAKLINMKQDELKTLAKDQPELYQRFAKDINQLDSSYNILKDQLSATPNKEMLLEAMIQNLQLQLNVLNQQLTIIHQIKNQTKKA